MKKCQDILTSIGWPSDILVLDFETYFDKDYSLGGDSLSTIEYILDNRFAFLGLAMLYHPAKTPDIAWGDFAGEEDLYRQVHSLQKKYGRGFENVTVVVHNAKFDISILYHKFGINPPYVIDTIDLDRHQEARARHSLKECATRYKLGEKGTQLASFKGLHYEDLTQEQLQDLRDYANQDAKLELDLFKLLLPKLSDPANELAIARHTLKMYLEPHFKVDVKVAIKLVTKMELERDAAINKVKPPRRDMKKSISGNISFVKMLQTILPPGEAVPTKYGKPSKNMIPLLGPGKIPALAQDDEGLRKLKQHKLKSVRDLTNARLAIKSWPLHICRIQRLVIQSAALGGYLGVPLHYYGGHLGRWSGAEKINLQNFGQRVDPLICQIKTLLYVPDGYTLIMADLAQIEARALAYLSGQQDMVDGFAAGRDIYSEFATHLFGCPIRKPGKTDPPPVAKLLGLRRYIGKTAILGAGYGLGADRFHETCMEEEALRETFTPAMAKKAIAGYRTKYEMIPKFWKDLETAFKLVSRYQYSMNKEYVGDITLTASGSTTYIKLPSSRVLTYQGVVIGRNGIKWKYGPLWGGTLTENVCQAYARDILRDIILKCEAQSIPVIHHVHDSIVSVVPENQVEATKEKIKQIMVKSPTWAPGLPLDAEIYMGQNYS